MKEFTSAGLEQAINKNPILDLKIQIKAPIVILPYGGKYLGQENVLVVNLGNFNIYTQPRKIDLKKLHQARLEEGLIEKLVKDSYDEFRLDFTNLQVNIYHEYIDK